MNRKRSLKIINKYLNLSEAMELPNNWWKISDAELEKIALEREALAFFKREDQQEVLRIELGII